MFESLFHKAGVLKASIFVKKEIPTQVFSCEYCEIFKNSFLVEHLLFIILLRVIEFFGSLWVQNWRVSYFLYYCFFFLHIGSPQLFRTYFYTKISSKSNFRTHFNVGSITIRTESLKIRSNCRTLATAPSNLLWKIWIWVFFNIMLYSYLSLEAVLLSWLKITQPKNKSM